MPVFNVRLTPLGSFDEDRLLLGRVQVSQSAVRGNAIVFRQLETIAAYSGALCAADLGPVPVSEIMFRLMAYSHEDGRTETCVSVANREEADTIPGFMPVTVLRSDNFTITVANAPEFTAAQRAEFDAAVEAIGQRMGQNMAEELERRFIEEVGSGPPLLGTPEDPLPPKRRTAPNCLRLMRRAVDTI